MSIVDTAMDMALVAHFGHTNPHDGEIYVLHLHRVAIDVRERGLDEVHQAVAWLHDSVEDWPERISIADIAEAFPDHAEIAANVNAISKKQNKEPNKIYYNRLLGFPIAARVKVSDLHDNFRRNHLIEDEAKRARMGAKYSLGNDILSAFR